MNRITMLLATSALAAAQGVSAAPQLSAVLAHEIIEQGMDGVTHSTHYQERFTRSDDTVWIERVLPSWNSKGAHAKKTNLEQHHDELNVQVAPRLIRPAEGGAAKLSLIDDEHHALFSVGTEDYERVGFSGRWAAEQSLIDPAVLRHMRKSSRPSKIAGTCWYEQETANEYTRLLWNETLQFPLKIETGVRSGRYSSRTTVLLGSETHQPWKRVGSYTQRELSDLGD